MPSTGHSTHKSTAAVTKRVSGARSLMSAKCTALFEEREQRIQREIRGEEQMKGRMGIKEETETQQQRRKQRAC